MTRPRFTVMENPTTNPPSLLLVDNQRHVPQAWLRVLGDRTLDRAEYLAEVFNDLNESGCLPSFFEPPYAPSENPF